MALPAWFQHVETFVDSTRPANEQAASLDAITALVVNDHLNIEALVKEMEMHLTTTDHVLRARGILLLAELLAHLVSKPLDKATIHSLVGFFTSRLADWQALHGALIGCLALLKRKQRVGTVSDSDARKLAQFYLQTLQVQALAQYDRLMCFELLECLLEVYPDAVSTLGDDLVHGVCESIDGEKDPQCLMLTFRIVGILVRLFPDSNGPVATYAEELFDLLGRYFPIYFTHPDNDNSDIKRDDLATALMCTLSSTPYFEPFCIPLLLEKLSSSLTSAKLDALKCLSSCELAYGSERMANHAKAIWSSLKDIIFKFSSQGPLPSLALRSSETMGSQENELVKEALICLERLILVLDSSNDSAFIMLIVKDDNLETIFRSVTSNKSVTDIPEERNQKLHALGSILSVSAKVSNSCCNRVFQSFFPLLMDILEIKSTSSSLEWVSNGNYEPTGGLNFGALCLCIELLTAGRDLAADPEEISTNSVFLQDTWCCLLQNFASSLAVTLGSILLNTSIDVEDNFYYGVKGLEVLATFCGSFSPVPKTVFENILNIFMSIIMQRSEDVRIWKLALKALVQIGIFIARFHDSEKESTYTEIVIEKTTSLISLDDSVLPLSLKLEAISDLGAIGMSFMVRVALGLEEVVHSSFLEASVNGNPKSAEALIAMLDCYSYKVLPWFQKMGGFDQVAMRFAINIWNYMDSCVPFDDGIWSQRLLDATMTATRMATGGCSEENQSLIVAKAYNIVSSRMLCMLNGSVVSTDVHLQSLQITSDLVSFSWKDEWLVSLFASVVIALRAGTPLPNAVIILKLLMFALLLKGCDAPAQALGSMVNKWPNKVNTKDIMGFCTLEEALDIILETGFRSVLEYDDLENNNISVQTHAVVGLAWIGKGLFMRGHEKAKDVVMLLLKCLLSSSKIKITPSGKDASGNGNGQDIYTAVRRSTADAFHVIMRDSEISLNKKFYATIRPLYKQHFFSSMMPTLLMSIKEADSKTTKYMLYRAFGHVFSDTPHTALTTEAMKVIPVLLDGLSILSQDTPNKDLIYSLLLTLSGILMDENGRSAIIENAHLIINRLIPLISYPHMTIVRETAIQCLIAMTGLPHARVYPMRTQVLKSISMALDDRKRQVRQEAVRCRQAWASLASRTLHF